MERREPTPFVFAILLYIRKLGINVKIQSELYQLQYLRPRGHTRNQHGGTCLGGIVNYRDNPMRRWVQEGSALTLEVPPIAPTLEAPTTHRRPIAPPWSRLGWVGESDRSRRASAYRSVKAGNQRAAHFELWRRLKFDEQLRLCRSVER